MNTNKIRRLLKRLIFVFIFSLLISACVDDQSQTPFGSIMFTSSHDCDFYLFDGNGRQITHDHCEAGKPPIVVDMKQTGIFIVLANSPGKKEVKKPLPFPGGIIEYYIEF